MQCAYLDDSFGIQPAIPPKLGNSTIRSLFDVKAIQPLELLRPAKSRYRKYMPLLKPSVLKAPLAALLCLSGLMPLPAALAQADATQPPVRPKIGLALGGGGTRGAAHVGVLKVLQKEGIPIDFVTGTSIGAIVGGLYCSGLPLSSIEQRFEEPAIMKNYLTVPVAVAVLARPLFLVPRLVGWRPYDGFYFGNRFRHYYRSLLPMDHRRIENLVIPFHAMCTNLRDGQPYPIDHGDLARAVQASSAIPVLRRPVPFYDAVLCDGAVTINLPVDEAKKMGADIIIAVPVNEPLQTVPGDTFRKVGSVARRLEQIFLSQGDDIQLSHADVVIRAHTEGVGVLSTNPKDGVRAIKAGEEATTEAIPEIKKKIDEWMHSKSAAATSAASSPTQQASTELMAQPSAR